MTLPRGLQVAMGGVVKIFGYLDIPRPIYMGQDYATDEY